MLARQPGVARGQQSKGRYHLPRVIQWKNEVFKPEPDAYTSLF